MSHHCQALLITCEDFRLHQRNDGRNYIAEFIKEQKVDCDLITRAGGVLDLVRPTKQGFSDCLLRDSKVSAKLHQAHTVYLINHEDCGAYSEMEFSSREQEIAQHKKDLHQAKEKILAQFPNLNIKLYFAELEQGSVDKFIILPVEQ